MIQFIRMLEDRDGAWDHIQIHTYQAGEVYSLEGSPLPISQDLLDGFVASGHAIEVDEQGDPVGKPADNRKTKVTGPKATKGADPTTPEDATTDTPTEPETPPAE